MSAILFDTTIVVDLLRRRPEAIRRLRSIQVAGDRPHVCAVTAEEVTTRLFPRERDDASRLFEGLEVAPLGIAEGRLAGWWRRTYRSRGRTLSQADCLIAAAAIGIGARLATGNPKDFPMSGLEVEHWPVGE